MRKCVLFSLFFLLFTTNLFVQKTIAQENIESQSSNDLVLKNDLRNRFLKLLYPEVELRNDNNLCIVSGKDKFSSKVFTECEILLDQLISEVIEQKKLSGVGYNFLDSKAYNAFLKYYLLILEKLDPQDVSELSQITIARFLYVLLEIVNSTKDKDLSLAVERSLSNIIFLKIFKDLGNEEFISQLGSLLVNFSENLLDNNPGSSIFFLKLALTYGTSSQFDKLLSNSFNYSNNELLNLEILKSHIIDNSLVSKNDNLKLVQDLIFCGTNFNDPSYNDKCSFLDNYEKKFTEYFSGLYIEHGINISKQLNFTDTFNFFSSAPAYLKDSETYVRFKKNTLPNLFKVNKLNEEENFKFCTLLKEITTCEKERVNKKNLAVSYLNIKYITLAVSIFILILICILLVKKNSYKFFKLKSENNDSEIILTPEERVELRELRSYFMLKPNSEIKDLAKNYRKKVKSIHPDSSLGSSQDFLLLQKNYSRIKVLLSRLNEEKENRLSKAESLFRY